MQVDARKIRQDKAWQAKTIHDTRQDTKTRHQDKTRQHTNTKASTTKDDRQDVTVNYILPVLFFSSYILIQIIVLSGYYNIGTKDRSQKAWTVVAKISHLYCSLYCLFHKLLTRFKLNRSSLKDAAFKVL